MCESNTAALCKSNGKALIRTAWQGNGMVCVNPPLGPEIAAHPVTDETFFE
jgi:hypothetical protein